MYFNEIISWSSIVYRIHFIEKEMYDLPYENQYRLFAGFHLFHQVINL